MSKLNLVEPSVELISELPMLQKIERAGRICYRSEGRIKDGSAAKFVKMIIDRKHLSVLGHAQLIIGLSQEDLMEVMAAIPLQLRSQFAIMEVVDLEYQFIVGAGVDAWLEVAGSFPLGINSFLKSELPELFYSISDSEIITGTPPVFSFDGNMELSAVAALWLLKETVVLTLDRAAAMQLRTHRLATHSVMSQRYINFEKYGFPYIMPEEVIAAGDAAIEHWYDCKKQEMENYHKWIELGFKPEIARSSIGSDIESSMVVTASLWEWIHIFHMRLDPHAQPAIRKVIGMVKDKLIEKYKGSPLEEVLTKG